MKKFKFLSIMLLIVFLLTGCGSTKKTIDDTIVQDVLEKYDYQVFDSSEKVGYAKSAYVGNKTSAKVNFVKGTKKYDIQGVFLDECKNVYTVAGTDYEHTTKGGKNWTYLEVVNEKTFYFVGWVDDAYITLNVPIEQKRKAQNMVKELGFR